MVVIGPNPARDVILEVPGFARDETQRARRTLHLAGGKPVNVARALRRLGIAATLVSPLGGDLGAARLIRETCAALDISLYRCEIAGETRTCVVIADTEAGEATVVNESGPHLSDEEAKAYYTLAAGLLRPGALSVASGSLPPGLPTDFYARLAARAQATGTRLIVDTSGDALRHALETGPWAVKVNGEELLAVTGGASVEGAACRLAKRIPHVVVTLGPGGSVYAGTEGLIKIPAIPVAVANPIGAGDAFLAGLVAGLGGRRSWAEALGEAASTAALVCARLEPDIGPRAE